MSVTMANARAEISRRAQEFVSATTTSLGTGGTLIDTTTLTHADDYWAESTVLLTSGTNSGQTRRVSAFAASTSTATLYASVTAAIASGVSYEMYRRFNPTDIKTALNRAINIGAPDFRERIHAIATGVADTLQYAVPTGLALVDKGLITIEYQHYTDASHTTWPFTKVPTDLYEILEEYSTGNNLVRKTLQLRFNPETNKLIRMVFDGPLGNVSADADVIHLDLPELEWLYSQSVAELWRIEASRTADVNRQAAITELARAESFADRLRKQLGQEPAPRPLRRSRFSVI